MVSLIIQGPLARDIQSVNNTIALGQILKLEIIVSCYKTCDINLLENRDSIKIVQSDDTDLKSLYNLKRQVFSTLVGLKQSTKEFAIKIRSDEYYEGLEQFIKLGLSAPNKYTTCNIFFLNGHGPSDHLIFGQTEKLIKGFELALKDIHHLPSMCIRPEDYLFLKYLKANNLGSYEPGQMSREFAKSLAQCVDIDLLGPYKWRCDGQIYTNSDYLYNNGYNTSLKTLEI